MYLVMSLCEGGELSKEVSHRGKLPEEETQIIMARLASAIAYLHKNGQYCMQISKVNEKVIENFLTVELGFKCICSVLRSVLFF